MRGHRDLEANIRELRGDDVEVIVIHRTWLPLLFEHIRVDYESIPDRGGSDSGFSADDRIEADRSESAIGIRGPSHCNCAIGIVITVIPGFEDQGKRHDGS